MTRLVRSSALIALVLAVSGCASNRPRPLGLDLRPSDRVEVPTSSLYYRSYDSAAGLARALRYTDGAERLVSAHRGAPVEGLAENAVPTFEHTLNYAAALVEMDVRRTADGILVLMHDETLDRTTTGQGRVDETSFEAIRRLRLLDIRGTPTPVRVPTLAEALAWAQGRAVLMVDVKNDVPYSEIVSAIRAADAENRAVVIVYSLADYERLFAIAPDLNISASVETVADAEALLASGVDLSRTIAFAGVGQFDPAVVDTLHAAGIRVQVGTFPIDAAAEAATNLEAYVPFLQSGIDVLATDNIRGASQGLRQFRLTRRARRTR